MTSVRMLSPLEWRAYRRHLLRLAPQDRRRRFGASVNDHGVDMRVEALDPARTTVFAAFDDALQVIAAAQATEAGDGAVELAFSVDSAHQGRGLGRALMDRACVWARNRGFRRAVVHFLAENAGMRRLANGAGMRVDGTGADREGALDLEPPNPVSMWREAAAENAALADFTLKAGRKALFGRAGTLRAA